jgi:hypothetical protein
MAKSSVERILAQQLQHISAQQQRQSAPQAQRRVKSKKLKAAVRPAPAARTQALLQELSAVDAQRASGATYQKSVRRLATDGNTSASALRVLQRLAKRR